MRLLLKVQKKKNLIWNCIIIIFFFIVQSQQQAALCPVRTLILKEQHNKICNTNASANGWVPTRSPSCSPHCLLARRPHADQTSAQSVAPVQRHGWEDWQWCRRAGKEDSCVPRRSACLLPRLLLGSHRTQTPSTSHPFTSVIPASTSAKCNGRVTWSSWSAAVVSAYWEQPEAGKSTSG